MSNTRHLDGKWVARGKEVFASNGGMVCYMADVGFEAAAMAEERARLIAAAPELLEALTALLKIQECGDVASWAPEWDSARSAIAKATGD